MTSGKYIFRHALLAALETSLLGVPLGLLLFYPFILQYEFFDWETNLMYSGAIMVAFASAMSFAVLVPATYLLQVWKKNISYPELGASLSTLSLVMVLGGTLIYNRFSKPGPQGKLLLFGLLMALMLVTWVFTVRYTQRKKNQSPEGAHSTANT